MKLDELVRLTGESGERVLEQIIAARQEAVNHRGDSIREKFLAADSCPGAGFFRAV